MVQVQVGVPELDAAYSPALLLIQDSNREAKLSQGPTVASIHELPRRVLLGNPYSYARIGLRDRGRLGD